MDFSSKIPQYNANNIYQNDPYCMFYPPVWVFIRKMVAYLFKPILKADYWLWWPNNF